jgi:hypothetical protein
MRALNAVDELGGDPEDTIAVAEEWWQRCLSVVEERWPQIENVAQELRSKRRLDGADLRALAKRD